MQQQEPKTLSYASDPCKPNVRLIVAIVFATLAALITGKQSAEVLYRLWLFAHDNKSEPGTNHVGDGSFESYHMMGAIACLISIVTAFLFDKWPLRIAAIVVAIFAVTSALAFSWMHKTGMLVTYSEWARMHGP